MIAMTVFISKGNDEYFKRVMLIDDDSDSDVKDIVSIEFDTVSSWNGNGHYPASKEGGTYIKIPIRDQIELFEGNNE